MWSIVITTFVVFAGTASAVAAYYTLIRPLQRRIERLEGRAERHAQAAASNKPQPARPSRPQAATTSDPFRAVCDHLVKSLGIRMAASGLPPTTPADFATLIQGLIRRARRHQAFISLGERTLKTAVNDAGMLEQRLEGIQRQFQTILAEANECLEKLQRTLADHQSLQDGALRQIESRKDLTERIDKHLRERQLLLVTDILRAEVERLRLVQAVDASSKTTRGSSDFDLVTSFTS